MAFTAAQLRAMIAHLPDDSEINFECLHPTDNGVLMDYAVSSAADEGNPKFVPEPGDPFIILLGYQERVPEYEDNLKYNSLGRRIGHEGLQFDSEEC